MRPRPFPRSIAVLWLACLALVPLSPAAAASMAEPSAQGILDRTASAYAGCRSYQDSGSVHSRIKGRDRESEKELTFSTSFVRPERFRFGFRKPQESALVWAQGDAVKSWWSLRPKVERGKSLGLALAGAAGVSGLTSHFIPSLLLPDRIEGRRLSEMTGLKRLDDASLEGIDCFRIQGVYGNSGRDLTLWIDKTTFLVRRIDSYNVIEDGGHPLTETATYLYHPVMNGDVPEERLAFDPPAGQAGTR